MDSIRPPQSRITSKPPLPLRPVSAPTKPVKAPDTVKAAPLDTPLYTKRKYFLWRKPIRIALLIMGGLFLLLTLFYGVHVIKTLNDVQLKSKDSPSFFSQIGTLTKNIGQDPFAALQKTDDGRINILLLGRAGENYPGQNLTDTIILMSIDSDKRKVALISLPRDLYVSLPEEHLTGKINSFYQYGLSQNQGTAFIEKAVTQVTGESLQYTFILDFDGFEKIIDTFGGVDLEVTRDIYDDRYPGKNYSYETFELHKGWQKLDGKTALKYVRERHDDPEGDFGRAKRQQQVLSALREKALGNSLLFNMNAVTDLLAILGESVKTNATLSDMENFLLIAKKIDTQNIESTVIDAWRKESLLRVSHVELGGVQAFTLVPRTGNWEEVQEVSRTIFSREQLLRRKEALQKEQATVSILYRAEDYRQAEQIKEVLEESYEDRIVLAKVSRYQEWPEKSMLLERAGGAKPWSMDTLLKKLSLEQTLSLPFEVPESTSDLLIVIGKDTETLLPDDLSYQKNDLPDSKEGDPLIIEHTDKKL